MRMGGMFWIGFHAGLLLVCALELNALGAAVNAIGLCLQLIMRGVPA